MLRPKIITGSPAVINARSTPPASTVSKPGPGPCTVNPCGMLMDEASRMVPVILNRMVSPDTLAATAARNVPGPLSPGEFTKRIVALVAFTAAQTSAAR